VRGVAQSELRKALGVTAPVVTRMMQSLEALGLVLRRRAQLGDKRQVLTWLTEAGEACILAARRAVQRAMRRMVFVAICFGAHRNRDKRFLHMATLESYLNALRRSFRDTARLCFRWGHPDD
jgi:DNA-binding MarR family transcriptional regulator